MTKQSALALFISLFLISACANQLNRNSSDSNENNEAEAAAAPSLSRSQLMSGLQNPWDLAFAPDGSMFFTEKCRGLSVRRPNGQVRRLFGTSGSALIARDLFCLGQSGMNGVAVDPNFSSNRFVYVYMASNLTSPRANRVVRLQVNAAYTRVSARTDIVTGISFKNTSNNWGGAGSHSGGRIRFGPDGFLYITTGDNHNGPLPQDFSRLGGKILRVDRNGRAASGNNTPSGDARIFTYGHRNVQGIAFRPGSGRAFISEHGPNHSDEVTALAPGGNGGWDPVPAPGVDCADNYCGYISNRPDGRLTSMTDLEKFPNALRPTWVLSDSSGMGPCTFISGAQWKDWNGALLVGLMASQELKVVELRSDSEVLRVSTAALPKARIRSLVQGPEGSLYIATDEGSIWKVTPQ